jgi:hypothetical protein
MIDLEAIQLRRAEEQTSGDARPAGGYDSWAIGRVGVRHRSVRVPKQGRNTRALTPEQVREIRLRLAAGESRGSIAARLETHIGIVHRVARREAYAWVDPESTPDPRMTCTGPVCGRRAFCRGLCETHYRQQERGAPLTRIRIRGRSRSALEVSP